jgi:hypothetical protein
MNKTKEVTPIVSDHYIPDSEEIQDAVGFLMKCSAPDLVESWSRISIEWDLQSISHVHKVLCNSGRIHDLVEGFRQI